MDACLRSVTHALQTLYIDSARLSYMLSKESQSGLKELPLEMYKAYDDREDQKCFDLGVTFKLKGYTPLEKAIGNIEWKRFMWDWTTKHWSMFLLLIIHSLNIKMKSLQHITFYPSHKIQKGATFKEFQQFINDISKETQNLMKHHKLFRRQFKIHKFDVKFAIEGNFQRDGALWFDSEEWKNKRLIFLYALEMERGAIFGWDFIHNLKNKTKFPSHTYWITPKTLIFDNESKKFHRGHRKYIRHRLLSSLSKIERKNSEFMKFIEYCIKFIYDVSLMDLLPVYFTNQNNMKYEYENYIRPVYARRVYAKYYLKLSNKISVELLMRFAVDKKIFSDAFRLDTKFRKNCEVCHAIQRFDDTIFERNKKYVDKMYHCSCLLLFVCGKRCQKIAWTKNPWVHRRYCCKRKC
eukprot:443752_1